jgi:hypothetical protein
MKLRAVKRIRFCSPTVKSALRLCGHWKWHVELGPMHTTLVARIIGLLSATAKTDFHFQSKVYDCRKLLLIITAVQRVPYYALNNSVRNTGYSNQDLKSQEDERKKLLRIPINNLSFQNF